MLVEEPKQGITRSADNTFPLEVSTCVLLLVLLSSISDMLVTLSPKDKKIFSSKKSRNYLQSI